MCGIVGQLAFGELDKKAEKMRQESMIFLGSELLQMTQERGKDATGVTLLLDDGNYIGLKMGIPSIEFISRFGKTNKEYGGFIKIWRKTNKIGKVFLGHCRQTTRGSSLDNDNNHPIKVGEIIGVHNGTVQNDDTIFEKLNCDRTGSVDSEAIFRLLHHYTKNGTEPFTINIMTETIQRLAGTFAVLAFSGNNPYQVCAFRDRRPIEMALIKPLKLVVCASEKKFIETSIYRYNKYINLYMLETGFPTITKSDIEFKMLIDDSAAIFDLRTEINRNTEIQELYDWEKIPRTRVWGQGTSNNYIQTKTNTVNTNPFSNEKKNHTSNPPTKDSTSAKGESAGFVPAEKGEKEAKPAAGRIWIRAINGYAAENSPEVNTAKEVGSVEINITTSQTNELPLPQENKKFALESKDKGIEKDDTKPQSAKIKELNIEPSAQDDHQISAINLQNVKTVEVDASVDAHALEIAEEAAKDVQQYESEEEVLTDLEIRDSETLKKIPITSLVNRIQKFIFKKGIYKGYLLRKAEKDTTKDNSSEIGQKKKESAEKNIRVLKTAIKILLRTLTFTGYVNNHALSKAVAQTLGNGEEISSSTLDKLFTIGDERNFKFITRMKDIINEKKRR